MTYAHILTFIFFYFNLCKDSEDFIFYLLFIINKYYSAGLTIQPFIIVEGLTDTDIKGFYVNFNSTLLKFNSFIECLDICFKIFHTLSLKYSEACEQPWQFIQQFFYDISTPFDL